MIFIGVPLVISILLCSTNDNINTIHKIMDCKYYLVYTNKYMILTKNLT